MSKTEERPGEKEPADERPLYEPPRLEKRRSLARVTGQVTGTTPGGTSANPPVVANG